VTQGHLVALSALFWACQPVTRAALPDCEPDALTPSIGGELRVRWFAGHGVPHGEAAHLASSLATYFAPYELVVHNGAPISLALSHALAGTDEALEEALAQAGPGTDPRFVAEQVAFSSLHQALPRHQPGTLDVIVLPHIAASSSPAARWFQRLEGLTVQVDGHPVVLLGFEELRRLPAGAGELVAPHEVGHALGLSHAHHHHNLMAQQRFSCVPGLGPDQARTIADSLAGDGSG